MGTGLILPAAPSPSGHRATHPTPRCHQFVTRYSKASAISLPPRLLRLLPAGAIVAGSDLHPLKNAALARRTLETDIQIGAALRPQLMRCPAPTPRPPRSYHAGVDELFVTVSHKHAIDGIDAPPSDGAMSGKTVAATYSPFLALLYQSRIRSPVQNTTSGRSFNDSKAFS